MKKYRENNKEKIIISNKKYRENHKEKIKKSQKYWEQNNKKKRSIYFLLYNKKYKNKRNFYYRNRRKNDLTFKLKRIISVSIWQALKNNNSSKQCSCLKYLDYTIEQLIQHLESQFEPWMNWNNYGRYDRNIKTWNIDHINPQSDLPYTSMEDDNFKICWSLSNLRPLEAKQNILDGVHKTRHKK